MYFRHNLELTLLFNKKTQGLRLNVLEFAQSLEKKEAEIQTLKYTSNKRILQIQK